VKRRWKIASALAATAAILVTCWIARSPNHPIAFLRGATEFDQARFSEDGTGVRETHYYLVRGPYTEIFSAAKLELTRESGWRSVEYDNSSSAFGGAGKPTVYVKAFSATEYRRRFNLSKQAAAATTVVTVEYPASITSGFGRFWQSIAGTSHSN
jgi:hypothetical protein